MEAKWGTTPEECSMACLSSMVYCRLNRLELVSQVSLVSVVLLLLLKMNQPLNNSLVVQHQEWGRQPWHLHN